MTKKSFSRACFTGVVIFCIIVILYQIGLRIETPVNIVPPDNVSEPTTVYVIQLSGFHPALVLPTNEKEYTLYVYGDWDYYAKDTPSLPNTLWAAVWPSHGGLGRFVFKPDTPEWTLAEKIIESHKAIIPIIVEQSKADQLSLKLNTVFEKQKETLFFNKRRNLEFVQTKDKYSLRHNCNHQMQDWLNDLDVKLKGFIWRAQFSATILNERMINQP